MTDISRFIQAQDGSGSYDQAIRELRSGRKTSHWIWYIFPQIKGLGHSYMSKFYAISSLDEARECLTHPILGVRLRECAETILSFRGNKDIRDIMGSGVDTFKLKSSMTLFDMVSPGDIFAEILDIYYEGRRDRRTIGIIDNEGMPDTNL